MPCYVFLTVRYQRNPLFCPVVCSFLETKVLLLENISTLSLGSIAIFSIFSTSPFLLPCFVPTWILRMNLVLKRAELGSLVAQQMKPEELKEVKPLDTFSVSFDELK